MKKYICLASVLFLFLFSSCYIDISGYDSNTYTTIITNTTSKTLRFYVNSAPGTYYTLSSNNKISLLIPANSNITVINDSTVGCYKSYDYNNGVWLILIEQV